MSDNEIVMKIKSLINQKKSLEKVALSSSDESINNKIKNIDTEISEFKAILNKDTEDEKDINLGQSFVALG